MSIHLMRRIMVFIFIVFFFSTLWSYSGDTKLSRINIMRELYKGPTVRKLNELNAYRGMQAVNVIVGDFRKKAYVLNYEQLAANYGYNVEFQLREKQIILCPQTAELLYSEMMVPKIRYVKGTRKRLEKIVSNLIANCSTTQEKALAIMRFCRDLKDKHTIKYGRGFLFGGTEEQLIEKGEDLCECLGRLFVALCEIAGIPARIIMHDISGHITAEAYIEGLWGYIDPKTGAYFVKSDGRIASVWELMLDPSIMDKQPAEVKADLHPKYKWDEWVRRCHKKYFNVKEVQGVEYYSLADADKYNYQQIRWEEAVDAGLEKINKKYRSVSDYVLGIKRIHKQNK